MKLAFHLVGGGFCSLQTLFRIFSLQPAYIEVKSPPDSLVSLGTSAASNGMPREVTQKCC